MRYLESILRGLLFASLATLSLGATLEPEDGKFYLGAWIDTEDTPSGQDSPVQINQRMSMNFSAFQDIPAAINPWDNSKAVVNITQIEATGTNAAIFMTVYANKGLTAFNDNDINELADQLYNITVQSQRNVFLRFSPEMNGNWFLYGFQPSEYVSTWQRVATAIRRRAPSVAMVWAPNLSSGYPYGGPHQNLSALDLKLLDTNNNGRVDNDDDPYTPFWPGDEYVDWVALSLYFKGLRANWPWQKNAGVATPTFVTELITGGGEGGSDKYNFYDMFCVQRNKPMAVAESNAAFQISSNSTGPIEPGPGHLAIARAYWSSYLTSPAFFTRFPKVKLINLFEFEKYETEANVGILRDFRVTREPAVAMAFLDDLKKSGMMNHIVQASARILPGSESPSNGGSSSGKTSGVKPDGVQRGLVGEIIKRFENKGFQLVALKLAAPGRTHLEEHYKDLRDKKFFAGLVDYMSSGPVVAMVWSGKNVVKAGRVLLGETNPLASLPGTIRGDFAIDIGRNICHGSDAVDSAEREIALWFPEGTLNYSKNDNAWIPLSSVDAATLIQALNDELMDVDPNPKNHSFSLSLQDTSPGLGAFLIIKTPSSPTPIGCGAVRKILIPSDEFAKLDELLGPVPPFNETKDEKGSTIAELKRMYIRPEFRGKGLGKKLVLKLEEEAKGLGVKRMLLETGYDLPAAMKAYEQTGYKKVFLYGEYAKKDAAACLCYGKNL
ncbi:hypothetical protein HDU97_010227 [Phlyctochytrium planicorne]|nr:hypothetical protein HDU97_010227 [Phlyctochytrium planicorne]